MPIEPIFLLSPTIQAQQRMVHILLIPFPVVLAEDRLLEDNIPVDHDIIDECRQSRNRQSRLIVKV